MKPTNEERRKVAAMLRELDVSDLGDERGIIDTPEEEGVLFSRILEAANDYRPGLHYAMSHFVARDAVELFADLIEPQERMCTFVYDDGEGEFKCAACGAFVTQHDTWEEYCVTELTAECFDYCPFCGAKVVER